MFRFYQIKNYTNYFLRQKEFNSRFDDNKTYQRKECYIYAQL